MTLLTSKDVSVSLKNASINNFTAELSDTSTFRKKRVLFIPASIRSHIIPTLYMADLIAANFDIYYSVTTTVLAEIVSKNGYTPIINDVFRIGVNMETDFLLNNNRKANFFGVLRSVIRNDIYWHRKQELDELMTVIRPDVVIIDIFNSTDFLPLYAYRSKVQLLFFNPMLSTYRVDKFPIVSESEWPSLPPIEVQINHFSFKKFIFNPRRELFKLCMHCQWGNIQKISKLSSENSVVNSPFTRLFRNIPELLLAPLQFELSNDIRQPNQHYLGLCIREERTDTEVDPHFTEQWPTIIHKRESSGVRIIYCSFGTYYNGPDSTLLTFIENLIDVVNQLDNVQLICSVNQLVIETVRAWHQTSDRIQFFSRVPQLKVLQNADVFITHGGLGSIKESIYYGVPMLVYPLDPNYDQPGNGLKVEYHKLGLRGILHTERVEDLQYKIQQLLDEDAFKTRLKQFRDEIESVSAERTIMHLLTDSFNEANVK